MLDTGFKIMTISTILNGNKVSNENFLDDLITSDLANFQFMPITSLDVEKCFLKYTNLLYDNRQSFNLGNIKQTQCSM